MSNKTGIVMKITENHIVLMMPDGSFKNIRRSYEHTPLLGERIDAENTSFSASGLRRISAIAAVACLVLVVSLFSYRAHFVPVTSYTIALDINPSLEIQTDADLKTIAVTALNKDAEVILEDTDYANKELNETLSGIIDLCVNDGYLSPEKEGLITVSVVPVDGENMISSDNISNSLQTALDQNSINAEIEIHGVPSEALEEAHRLGMSVNRYIIYSELAKEGIKLSAEETAKMSMRELKNYSSEKKNKNNGNDDKENNGIGNDGLGNEGQGDNGKDNNGKENNGKENDGKENNGQVNNGQGNNRQGNNGQGNNKQENGKKGDAVDKPAESGDKKSEPIGNVESGKNDKELPNNTNSGNSDSDNDGENTIGNGNSSGSDSGSSRNNNGNGSNNNGVSNSSGDTNGINIESGQSVTTDDMTDSSAMPDNNRKDTVEAAVDNPPKAQNIEEPENTGTEQPVQDRKGSGKN